MSLLAHAARAARSYDTAADRRERRGLDDKIQDEIREAKQTQAQTGCPWSEALRIAGRAPGAPRSIPHTAF